MPRRPSHRSNPPGVDAHREAASDSRRYVNRPGAEARIDARVDGRGHPRRDETPPTCTGPGPSVMTPISASPGDMAIPDESYRGHEQRTLEANPPSLSWTGYFRPSASDPVAGAARAITHLDSEGHLFLVVPQAVPLACPYSRSHAKPVVGCPGRLNAVSRVARHRMHVHRVAAHVPEIDAVRREVLGSIVRPEVEAAILRLNAMVGADIHACRRRGCRAGVATDGHAGDHQRASEPGSARLSWHGVTWTRISGLGRSRRCYGPLRCPCLRSA